MKILVKEYLKTLKTYKSNYINNSLFFKGRVFELILQEIEPSIYPATTIKKTCRIL